MERHHKFASPDPSLPLPGQPGPHPIMEFLLVTAVLFDADAAMTALRSVDPMRLSDAARRAFWKAQMLRQSCSEHRFPEIVRSLRHVGPNATPARRLLAAAAALGAPRAP